MDRLPAKTYDKVVKRFVSLGATPRPVSAKKLQAREGYPLRVGNYRILYEVNDEEQKVEVYSIGHRREVYRVL